MLRAYSYEQLFQIMRKLRLPCVQAEEMYRRMVFNVIARNQDDHTKNASFIMNKNGVWSLSPAYYISWAYRPSEDWTSMHQVSINNKWDDFSMADLLELAAKMNVKKPKQIIEQVNEAVALWARLASEHSLSKLQIEQIRRTHRIDIRLVHCAQKKTAIWLAVFFMIRIDYYIYNVRFI